MVVARSRVNKSVVVADCLASDMVGNAVYIRDQANGLLKVAKTDTSDSSKMPAIGVIVAKFTETRALVQLQGEVRVYTDLVPGKSYLVGPASIPSISPPIPPPSGRSFIQKIGIALDTKILFLNPSPMMSIRVA